VRIINRYKKLIVAGVAMVIISATTYVGIDIILFEFTSIKVTYELDIVFEYLNQLVVLLTGLILYHKIDASNPTDELKKGLLITFIYAFFMGQFHQMIYPASELPTFFERLILNLKHSWILIIAGIGIVIIKYVCQRIKGNKITIANN
jgi:hypothetical protein